MQHLSQFPAKPNCPACSVLLPDAADSCPRCRFTASHCLQKFPFQAPPLERFIDPSDRLQPNHRRALKRAINRFEKVFPQTRFYICLTRLPNQTDSREFGYWLFNASPPRDAVEEQQRHFGILLLIDRKNRKASLTVGYGLDAFLSNHALSRVLSQASLEFKTGKYHSGILKIISGLEAALRNACADAQDFADTANRRRPTPSPAPSPEPIVPQSHPLPAGYKVSPL